MVRYCALTPRKKQYRGVLVHSNFPWYTVRVKKTVYLCAAVFTAAVLLSCAQTPATRSGPPPEAARSAGAPAAAVPQEGNRLGAPDFKNLPAEARAYLERLAEAFSAQDEAFLLAQGEPQFEAENRPRHDKENYLALLYRIGVYATDSPRVSEAPPQLVPSAISHVQYLSWEEKGPLLEIKARLAGKDGTTIPSLIMLVWRLREPKIEGLFL
jgi:hypothetical protein